MKKAAPKTRSESKSNRGGKRDGAGRKPSGNVRLQYWVKPATKKAIETKAKNFDHAGLYLDSFFNSD